MKMMLATFGTQRRPRVVRAANREWARAWAKRWWEIDALCADDARKLIERADAGLGTSDPTLGRIIDTGRHAKAHATNGAAIAHDRAARRKP